MMATARAGVSSLGSFSVGTMRRRVGAVAVVVLCLFAQAPPLHAEGVHPLLMEGKTSLYQRVLTRPGAELLQAPGANTAEKKGAAKQLAPFSAFYVFERDNKTGEEWVRVGPSATRPPTGYINAADVIDWKQTMTVAFANPAGRDRVLFFRDRATLETILKADKPAVETQSLRYSILKNTVPEGFPVISTEPSTYVDITKQFYLLPILDARNLRLKSRLPVRVLKVASATLEPGDEDSISKKDSWDEFVSDVDQHDSAISDFKAGIVFVIDASMSMDAYIDRTRAAITKIYGAIERAKLLGKVSFGLVAFRSSTNAVPALEYVSRIFGNLDEGLDPKAFTTKIADVKAAKVSSAKFSEDSFAGVVSAIQDLKWNGIGGRYIVLITDAGSIHGNDPLSSTKMEAEQVRSLALENKAAIYTLHLWTPSGERYHERDAAQYAALSDYPGVGSLYYGVEAGDVEKFGSVVDALAKSLVGQVYEASKSKVAEPAALPPAKDDSEAASADEAPPLTDQEADAESGDKLKEFTNKSLVVGRSMQLAYLGGKKGAKAPRLIEAWVVDRDFERPTTPSLEVRVLLTRNQLSDLQASVKSIIEAGEQAIASSSGFLDQIRSAAATLSRDPSKLGKKDTKTLQDSGLLGEYLDGLPYQSKVMSIDEELWSSWSAGEQEALINELKSKIELYRKFHDDVENWVSLSEGSDAGEAVYPVPLESLP